ncbi:hypothetical protein FGB62_334g06 [Gracilaria domingensis]|nr:hypothetical protein FGB62_334g06 [Gracilaria domingensis]
MRERGAIIMKATHPAEYRVTHHAASGVWDMVPTVNAGGAPPTSPSINDSPQHASKRSGASSESPKKHTDAPTHSLSTHSAVLSASKKSATHRRFSISMGPNRHFVLHPSATSSRHFVLFELHAGPSMISYDTRVVQHPSQLKHDHDEENDDGVQVATFTCDGVWKRSYTISVERLVPDELVVFCFWLVNLMNRRANRADPAHVHGST